MRNIFDESMLGTLKLKNRIFRSATWMAMTDNGHLNSNIINLYDQLSKSEIAAIITGITSVYSLDQKIQGMLSFDDDTYIEEHQKLTGIVHENDSHIFMQIAIVDILSMYLDESINHFTKDEIKKIIKLFADAGIRAKKAGYDGVQIHAAHFFFLSKFISPLYNSRKDEYGGSNENRSRILTEIISNIKQSTGKDFIVLIKINATDYVNGGLEIDDCVEICEILDRHGIDAIEISANNTSRSNIKAGVNESFFREYGERIKSNVNCPVILVGGHRSIVSMNELLNQSDVDYLSLSRPLICEPDLIKRWKDGNTEASKCVSCNSCYNTPFHQCILNI